MQLDEASKTAEYNALFRALETYRRPPHKRLFTDFLAPSFLGPRGSKYFRLSGIPLFGRLVLWYIDKNWPGVRPSSIGRTCWIDDQLRDALHKGITQIVILGAGFDCRAYRLPELKSCHVFELDQLSTLTFKKDCLKAKLGTLPENVSYVEIDFDKQDLAIVLNSVGFDRSHTTIFLWEGVMHYLTADAVNTTLQTIAHLAPVGSRLIFTYIHQGLLDGTVQFGDLRQIPSTLRESKESWIFGLYPEDLASYLAERGLTLLQDVDSIEYRTKYMGSKRNHLKGFEFYHAALALVNGKNTF